MSEMIKEIHYKKVEDYIMSQKMLPPKISKYLKTHYSLSFLLQPKCTMIKSLTNKCYPKIWQFFFVWSKHMGISFLT